MLKTIMSIKNKNSKAIPEAIRKSVWNTYIGKEKGEGMCYMDCKESISRSNFECGHIIPSSVGGNSDLYNLRPICPNCNKSMGTQNMLDFYKNGGFKVNKKSSEATPSPPICKVIKKSSGETPNPPMCKVIKKSSVETPNPPICKVKKSRMDKVKDKLDSKDICYLLRTNSAKALYQEKNLSELKNMLDEDKFISFLKGETTKYYGRCDSYECIFEDHDSSYFGGDNGKCIKKILYKINKLDLLYYISKINNNANKNMSHKELIECIALE